MGVVIKKRKNANGTVTLMLDIYHNGKRTYERLAHLQLVKPSNALDRENNKELLQKAEAIRLARAVELEGNNYNMDNEAGKKTIITEWMQSYVDTYNKKDKRNMQGSLNRFINFLAIEKKTGLTFGNLTALLIEDFIDHLQSKSIGEGASSYYNRFKKMLKYAYRKRIMKANVLDFVEKKVKGKAKKKDILTIEEIKVLAATPTRNSELRRAALFSTVTGLAFCDIKLLQWKNIKFQTGKLEIVRGKGEIDNYTVTIHLNTTAFNLLGVAGKPDTNVFELPTANGCNKSLKAWVKRAGIDKKITWHNLRHSYGTNLVFNDVDILTTSKLMGHTSTKHTMRYVTASDEMKQRGTDKINIDL